jgi:Flp pilus assembly secretin CpaC
MLTAGSRSKEIRSITESSDAYLTFNKDIERAAVGSAEVLKITTPSKREIVLNGAKVGRTSVTVWFAGGGSEQFMIAVTRDLSVLENALKDIALTIQVQIAADRDAVVLTGSVPDEAPRGARCRRPRATSRPARAPRARAPDR